MVLLDTVAGGLKTQGFGPSSLAVEPAMWTTGDKAYWLSYAGASFVDDFHPGIDRAAPYGTDVRAMERGIVVFAGFKDGISGNQVEVEIREGTRFSVNHLAKVLVRVGQHVSKGQTIGRVGTSGATTGPHTHEGLSIREKDSAGVYRTFLYNPALFQEGGKFANDPRIKPEERYVVLNGPGINLRNMPLEFGTKGDVFARSRDAGSWGRAGIYRIGTGKRIAPITKQLRFIRWADTDEGEFAVVTGFNRRLAVRRTLIHFV